MSVGRAAVAMTMSVNVSDLFREYEADFLRLQKEIDDRLDSAKAADAHEQTFVTEAERRVGQADQALRQMEMEARTMPPDTRSHLEKKIHGFRSDLGEQRKVVETAREAAHRRALLNEGPDGTALGKSMRDRERLVGVGEALSSSTSRLSQAQRQALETEQIGIDVMSDLRSQRDVIIRTRGNVGEIGENTSVARQLLDGMTRRAMANKFMSYAVAAFMLLMIVALIYFGQKGQR
mmetsp:Transcript_78463/g.173828  ORF Transcript_78463/g.173828 Transcript_78463/m.173828 type:complete len:235 (-) Transcript_78463:30-734(-)